MSRRLAAVLVVAAMGLTPLVAGNTATAVQYPQTQVVSAHPVSWTPNVTDGQVESIIQIGNTIYIAGSFSGAQNAGSTTTLTRNNILAFNATTGVISTTFAPNFDGEITTLLAAPDGQSLYAGGFFNTVNGQAAKSLALISASNGSLVTSFRPPTMDGRVKDLRLSGGRLWVAGTFSSVGGSPHSGLATVDPVTGGVLPYMNLQYQGVHNGGGTQVLKMDISPDGRRLISIGNFTAVDGSPHEQIAMLDISGPSAALADWQTNFYTSTCASVFNTYMRDLDFSPDGSFFVVSTTGAYRGYDTACDETSRWETSATGSDLRPSWTDYTGGDTTYAVAITDAAVYVGGHMRWENNPFAGDSPGPGAVAREGIAALDPVNGLPFSWNPGRAKGVGVFDMLATPQGLWVGSDTTRIGNQYHARIAMLPLAGGSTPPPNVTGRLPGNVYLGGNFQNANPNILYRFNAGGPTLMASDGSLDWQGDQSDPVDYRNSGSNSALWSAVPNVDSTVPSTTPRAIFDSERWDPGTAGDGGEMHWALPVPSGTGVDVRLYFANRCGCTSQVGQRIFDVAIDGTTVLNNFDLVAAAGDQTGTMRSFPITSDGEIDIDFQHVVENPLINGIEIVRKTAPATPSSIYRVNAGGGALSATDAGPDWLADDVNTVGTGTPFRTGGNPLAWGPIGNVDGSVPASTPSAVFSSERWDPGNPDMHFQFPVPTGTPVTVRLYFANQCSCTSQPGQRVFDVALDGTTVLNDYDIVADVGDQTGTMKSFDLTSDGRVDVDFSHVVENPLIDAIEIVQTGATPPPPPSSSPDVLTYRHYDGSTAGPSTNVSTSIAWGSARGAVMIDGKVYYGYSDGNFYSRTFNGSTFGSAVAVNTSDLVVPLADWHNEVPNITGMFFVNGRLFFTLYGQSNLYYRYFSPESGVVGALRFTASGNLTGVNWGDVAGMFTDGGELYFATRSNGALHRVDFTDGRPVDGTAATVSGPTIDGVDWRTRAMFLSTVGLANDPPVAAFTSNCSTTQCSFDGAGSSDSDGTITGYSWNFGDGGTASGVQATHTYAASGTYNVQLAVTDNDGATDTVTHSVSVSAPTSAIAFRGESDSNANATSHSVTVPGTVRPGDALLLFTTVNSTTVTVAGPSGVTGWTQVADFATGSERTLIWKKVAVTGDGGNTVSLTLSATAKADVQLLAYTGTSTTDPVSAAATTSESTTSTTHTTPTVTAGANSWLVSYWADKSSSTTNWTEPAGQVVRDESIGSGSGRITSLVTDAGAAVPVGTVGGLTATTDASTRAAAVSIVLVGQ